MYDVIIIGSGPAGLSAAVYAKQACLNVLVLEKEAVGGGQIIYASNVDNYPGLSQTKGYELAQKFESHAKSLGAGFQTAEVTGVRREKDDWQVELQSGNTLKTKTVLIATGARHRKLGVPGENKLAGMGVSYCAVCDGAFFREKTVAVVGGGDVALSDALYLAKGCKQVYLIHRRQKFRAAEILKEQIRKTENITFLPDTVLTEIRGQQKVESVVLCNKKDNTSDELAVDGVFPAIGMEPQTDFIKQLVILDNGYICAKEDGITSQSGVFAAGDVRTKKLRQIITAAADGANAVASILDYINSR